MITKLILKKSLRVWSERVRSGWAALTRFSEDRGFRFSWVLLALYRGTSGYRRCKRTQTSRRIVSAPFCTEAVSEVLLIRSQCHYKESSKSHTEYLCTTFKRPTLTTVFYYNFRNFIVLRVLYILIDIWSPCWWRMTETCWISNVLIVKLHIDIVHLVFLYSRVVYHTICFVSKTKLQLMRIYQIILNDLKPTKCINDWIYLFIILDPLLHVSAPVLCHHQGAHCSWLKLLTSVMELKLEIKQPLWEYITLVEIKKYKI
jgi:hypothetical protein